MRLYARGSFTGNYQPQGNESEADCVIGNEFAFRRDGFGNVNELLAEVVAERYSRLSLMLNRNIAGALEIIDSKIEPALIFSGESTNLTATKGKGAWGELEQARDYMDEHGLERPIIVAQAYHVGRVALQAKRLGLNVIIPEGLPRVFDPESMQLWSKGPIRMAIREAIGAPVLRHRGHL